MKESLKLQVLFASFIAMMIAMNLLGVKITTIFGVSVSVAIFMVPFTFLITDIVAEIYGKKTATQFVITGVIALFVIFGFTALSVVLPPNERYPHNDAYRTIFGSTLRMIFASIVAFAISQYHDVWAFHFWKSKTKGKYLWLRNNLSTWVSQAIDSFIFLILAFYKTATLFDLAFIFKLFLPYYIFKIIFAAMDTPLVYLGVWWLKQKSSPPLKIRRDRGEL